MLASIFGFIGVARVGRPRTAGIIGLGSAGLALIVGIVVTVSRF